MFQPTLPQVHRAVPNRAALVAVAAACTKGTLCFIGADYTTDASHLWRQAESKMIPVAPFENWRSI